MICGKTQDLVYAISVFSWLLGLEKQKMKQTVPFDKVSATCCRLKKVIWPHSTTISGIGNSTICLKEENQKYLVKSTNDYVIFHYLHDGDVQSEVFYIINGKFNGYFLFSIASLGPEELPFVVQVCWWQILLPFIYRKYFHFALFLKDICWCRIMSWHFFLSAF